MEALETPGVEITSTNCRCIKESPEDMAKSTNDPKEHPSLYGELAGENLLLGNKVGGTLIPEDKVPGRI